MDPKTHNVIEPVYLRTVVKTALGLHTAADLDPRDLQGAGRLRRPAPSASMGDADREPGQRRRRPGADRDASTRTSCCGRRSSAGRLQPNERLVEADLIPMLDADQVGRPDRARAPRAGGPRRARAQSRREGSARRRAGGRGDPGVAHGARGAGGEVRGEERDRRRSSTSCGRSSRRCGRCLDVGDLARRLRPEREAPRQPARDRGQPDRRAARRDAELAARPLPVPDDPPARPGGAVARGAPGDRRRRRRGATRTPPSRPCAITWPTSSRRSAPAPDGDPIAEPSRRPQARCHRDNADTSALRLRAGPGPAPRRVRHARAHRAGRRRPADRRPRRSHGASRSSGSPASSSSRTTPRRPSAPRSCARPSRASRSSVPIALNRAVGGMNPVAIEIAAREGARTVWFPTVDSENESGEETQFPPGAQRPGLDGAPARAPRRRRRDRAGARGRRGRRRAPRDAGVPARRSHGTGSCSRPATSRATRSSRSSRRRARRACRRSWSRTRTSRRRTSRSTTRPSLAARGALLERCFTTPHTGKVDLGAPLRGDPRDGARSTRCSPPISARRRTRRSRTGSG